MDFDYIEFWKILLFSLTKKIFTEIPLFFMVTSIKVSFIFQILVFHSRMLQDAFMQSFTYGRILIGS